jgi:hypothetical protein
MKARRLVVATLLCASLGLAGPSFADQDQPLPGPNLGCSLVRGLLCAAAYGIEISGALL